MAAFAVSYSPTMLFTSEMLENTSVNADAAGKSQVKSRANHDTRTTSRRTTQSEVTIVPKPKRAKFEPRRREQVANVRKKGACMRCRIKKLPVGADVFF